MQVVTEGTAAVEQLGLLGYPRVEELQTDASKPLGFLLRFVEVEIARPKKTIPRGMRLPLPILPCCHAKDGVPVPAGSEGRTDETCRGDPDRRLRREKHNEEGSYIEDLWGKKNQL